MLTPQHVELMGRRFPTVAINDPRPSWRSLFSPEGSGNPLTNEVDQRLKVRAFSLGEGRLRRGTVSCVQASGVCSF